jgi:hypothetical protein
VRCDALEVEEEGMVSGGCDLHVLSC